ncbi:MAG TPA: hypothetical protein VH280_14530 [Verrucomicrobiae bacterium]|jgi:hypothetical protein|nr:hypothetical protein [Verrucomicrobiae bacterium]
MSKSSKWRACPALGRDISTADCGEQRQSRLACPSDCSFNLFNPANYSRLLEIEDLLDKKTSERLRALTPDPDAFFESINHAVREGDVGLHAFFVWQFFFEKDRDGRTFGQRWEAEGFRNLKNDERVLWRGKMRSQIALLEVHRVQEDGRMEAVDLLSPQPTPMIFRDRSLASTVCRFSTILGWIYPLPHFWRLSGTGTTIPDIAQFTGPEIVREIVRHLGGPLEETEMRLWLAEHFVHFNKSLTATAHLRRRQMLSAMDAKWGKAVYELQAPFAQCRNRLDEAETIHPDDLSDSERDEGFAEARVCFNESSGTDQFVVSGKPVLGRILLGQSLWRLETFGAEKLAQLRRQFEGHLGSSIRFQGERLDDLAARLNSKEPHAEASLVPPRLLENPNQIAMTSSRLPVPPGGSPEEAWQKWVRETEKAFLDENVPALNHRTPREAARDEMLRPKLVQLLKERIRSCDEQNLRTGERRDLNWMLKELDLNELIFDPPPWRPPPPVQDAEDEETFDPNRPPAPPLPSEPLTFEDASERFQKSMDWFDTFAMAENELIASGSTLLEDASELTRELLSEEEFSVTLPLLAYTWFALVPKGYRAPELNFDAMERTFKANLRKMDTALRNGTEKQFESCMVESPQPNIILLLSGMIMESLTAAPKEFRPSIQAQPIIMTLLKTVIEELDTQLRP